MKDRPVQVLLDASAIVAFTRSSIHVGEVIAEVDDEQAAVGLPLLCLVEATRAVADPDRLDLLVNHRATVILADDAADWRALAPLMTSSGGSTPRRPRWPPSTWTWPCSPLSRACTAAWPMADRSSPLDRLLASAHRSAPTPSQAGTRMRRARQPRRTAAVG